MRWMMTPHGLAKCTVEEFDPTTYKGLRSGIGKTRRSSKHFNCKKLCCTLVPALKKRAK